MTFYDPDCKYFAVRILIRMLKYQPSYGMHGDYLQPKLLECLGTNSSLLLERFYVAT